MEVHDELLAWFAAGARDLPWRRDATPWGILVCEVMGQQTPMSRVIPRWQEWMRRWPDPCSLAHAPQAEVLRAWDRMGYPSRALHLHRCAAELCDRFGGTVPADEAVLRGLPGIGSYTAAAVAAFAFRRRTTVLDTNVRRVLARLEGRPAPSASPSAAERARATALLPQDPEASATWNEALMELGALVCTPRPRCGACPIAARCAWLAAGRPADPAPPRRPQSWHGTDRQARGRILAALREQDRLEEGPLLAVARVSADAAQPARALASLVADGLVTESNGAYALGGGILHR